MKKTGILAILLCAAAVAAPLSFESGVIKGHTEVFGNSNIDPMFTKARSHLDMEQSPLTLRGSIDVSISDFISDCKKCDEHMYETLESAVFPKAVFEIKEVVAKGEGNYLLKGGMNLHGVTKPMIFEGSIAAEGNKVRIKANSSMKMSDFGIKPPKMVFVTVRDQVDVSADIVLKR